MVSAVQLGTQPDGQHPCGGVSSTGIGLGVFPVIAGGVMAFGVKANVHHFDLTTIDPNGRSPGHPAAPAHLDAPHPTSPQHRHHHRRLRTTGGMVERDDRINDLQQSPALNAGQRPDPDQASRRRRTRIRPPRFAAPPAPRRAPAPPQGRPAPACAFSLRGKSEWVSESDHRWAAPRSRGGRALLGLRGVPAA